jgi:hypothetical protein
MNTTDGKLRESGDRSRAAEKERCARAVITNMRANTPRTCRPARTLRLFGFVLLLITDLAGYAKLSRNAHAQQHVARERTRF